MHLLSPIAFAQVIDIAKPLQDFFTAASNSVLPYLAALAALGILTMSLCQAAKNLLPVRYVFQGWFLRRWLQRHSVIAYQRLGLKADADGRHPSPEQIVRVLGGARRTVAQYWRKVTRARARKHHASEADRLAQRAEIDIILLAADANAVALFDSDGDAFCKQLSAVAQMVIDFPLQYKILLGTIACHMDPRDFQIILAGQASAEHSFAAAQPPKEQEAALVQHASEGEVSPQEFLNAKNRVRQQVAQSISAFQLRNSWGWATVMRIASFIVSAILALAAQWFAERNTFSPVGALLTAVLAAFLAPVARDMVAAIEKLRS